MLSLGLAAAAFTAPPMAMHGHAVSAASAQTVIMQGMNTRDTGPKKKKPSSARSLWGYQVGDRAPASAVSSGTTKARSFNVVKKQKPTLAKNTRDTGPKKKRGTADSAALRGYTVGSRAPSVARASGTTTTRTRQSGGGSIFEDDIGVLPPLGIFDPLGLIETRDMRRYEIMEIKHGRAAMLGFLHVITVEAGWRIPTKECLAAPTGLFASLESVPTAGWLQIMVLTCMQETGYFYAEAQTDDKEPGDIATDGWVRYDDPELKKFKLNIERQNGRAAMMGITGCLVHELLGVDALYPTGGYGGAAPPAIF